MSSDRHRPPLRLLRGARISRDEPLGASEDVREAPDPRLDGLPDVRDGLTRAERVVLWQLHELQKERGDRNVPTAMLYGRVVEHVDMSVDQLTRILQRMMGKLPTGGG